MLDGGGAGEQQDAVGHLGGGNPDFLAVDDIAVAAFFGPGFEAGGVQAGGGFGDAEARFFLASHQGREEARLLRGRAEDDDRVEAEDVHMDGRGAGHAGTAGGDGFHHDRGFGDAQARAAIFFWDADAQIAGLGHGGVEFVGEAGFLVARQPIGIVEAGAEGCHAVADGGLGVVGFEIHVIRPGYWRGAPRRPSGRVLRDRSG